MGLTIFPRVRQALAALGFLALSACAGAPDPLEIFTTPLAIAPAPVIHPPLPAPLALVPFEWDVLPPGQTSTEPLYCVDSRGYAAQAHDFAELLRFTTDAAALIRHYRTPAEPLEETTP